MEHMQHLSAILRLVWNLCNVNYKTDNAR